MSRRGRRSIFQGKMATLGTTAERQRVQGVLSVDGARAFERARRQLRVLYRGTVGKQPPSISDGECIEYLARGVDETLRVLREAVSATPSDR